MATPAGRKHEGRDTEADREGKGGPRARPRTREARRRGARREDTGRARPRGEREPERAGTPSGHAADDSGRPGRERAAPGPKRRCLNDRRRRPERPRAGVYARGAPGDDGCRRRELADGPAADGERSGRGRAGAGDADDGARGEQTGERGCRHDGRGPKQQARGAYPPHWEAGRGTQGPRGATRSGACAGSMASTEGAQRPALARRGRRPILQRPLGPDIKTLAQLTSSV